MSSSAGLLISSSPGLLVSSPSLPLSPRPPLPSPPRLPAERRALQAGHVRHLAGRVPGSVQGDAGGAVGGALLRRQHPLLPAGPLPVPGHAGSPAQVLLRLDSRWGCCNTSHHQHWGSYQIVFSDEIMIYRYPLSDVVIFIISFYYWFIDFVRSFLWGKMNCVYDQ